MEKNRKQSLFFQYVGVTLLIAFSSFEYFFRETAIMYTLFAIAIVICIAKGKIGQKGQKDAMNMLALMAVFSVAQGVLTLSIGSFTLIPIMFGCFSLALLVKERFCDIFVNVITFIAFYSFFIWLAAQNDGIRDYLVNNLSSHFHSLNSDIALNEGGGSNIIIFNFYNGGISKLVGFLRNCGPFWEPGQFAVFLNLALFFNLILKQEKLLGIKNIILLIALITTFSTGGYMGALTVLFVYFASRKGVLFKIIGLVVIVVLSIYAMRLDYIGGKINEQIYNTATGNEGGDRFSAMFTQLQMIIDSPIVGGVDLKDYTDGVLANGILWVFVFFGIPTGIAYYWYMVKACKNITKYYSRESIYLFLLIIVLAFSQTITTTRWMFVLVFVGLLLKNIKYGYKAV